jgi:hypothetical protein
MWRSESGLWPLAVLVLVLSAAAAVVDYRRRRHRGTAVLPTLWLAGSDILVAGNLAMAGVLTLSPGGTGRVLNLVPFKELADLLAHRVFASVSRVEIIGNLLLFVPAACVLYLRGRLAARAGADRGRVAVRTVCLVGAIALGIEATQYLLALGRVASITDVLLPTIGAALGVATVESALLLVWRVPVRARLGTAR